MIKGITNYCYTLFFTILNDSLGGFSFQTVDGKKQVSTDGGNTWSNFSGGLDLLWTNPNPMSMFDAQTVSIDLSGYESVIIIAKGWYAHDDYASIKQLIPKDGNLYLIIANQKNHPVEVPMSDYAYTWYGRTVTVTDTGITFSNGYVSGTSIRTDACIPLEIYGTGISWG